MQSIDRETVKQWLEEKRDVTLIEVLDESQYRDFHLPGAINVPVQGDFETRIQETIPDRFTPVVVYCYDRACTASPKAAKKMDQLGYQKVYDYEGGKVDWKEAGLPVERP